ncbi:MAG: aldo/keto reductase, partial [bacterium]
MVYRKLGNTDLYLSSIGLGTWAMGNDFFGHVDDQQSIKAIQVAIEEGINFIDTAPSYGNGHAEEIIGKAIKGKRDQVNIATKCGITLKGGEYIRNLKPERIEQEIDESLERLGIETIDLYQLH